MGKLLGLILSIFMVWAVFDCIKSNRSTTQKILWILALVFFSVVSLPVYFIFGRKSIGNSGGGSRSDQSNTNFAGTAWGGVIGFMFAGPLGAIAGAYLGHSFNQGKDRLDAGNIFQINLISILSHVAKADGEVAREEVQLILQFFQNLGFNELQMAAIGRAFNLAVQQEIDLKSTCENFRKGSKYEERLMLLRVVYMVVMADKVVHPNERAVIDLIVQYLGIAQEDNLSLQTNYFTTKDSYYEVLGLQRGVSKAEVKKAYRKLALNYHPDRVAHLGAEYVKVAEEKFKTINEAYDKVTQELAATGA